MKHPNMENMIANMPDVLGIGKWGSVTATAVAFHAATEGYWNPQPSDSLIIHGYLLISKPMLSVMRKTTSIKLTLS
jgi:hypothetical protein